MYQGAIKFSETKWKQMDPDLAIELMLWINHSFEPGYMVHKVAPDMCYFVGEFVGESDLNFDTARNKIYPIYKISIIADDFYLEKTLDNYNLP